MRRKMKATLHAGVLLASLITLLCGFTWQDHVPTSEWEKFDFAKQPIDPRTLPRIPLKELKLIRGIIFGRHGRIFMEQEIQEFLYTTKWYKPDDNFTNAMLNATERQNLDLIREAETRKHQRVEPGDLRFYQDKLISNAMLGKPTLAELHIMQAEIEAIRGKRFEAEPSLQKYFEERYWYAPAAKYDPGALSEIERQNLTTLATFQKVQRNLKLAPGDMISFQNRLVTEDLLRGLSLHELRLIRNEIYALRGRQFRTFWIQDYFYGQSWYKPMEDFREPELSDIEKKNIATIVAFENRIHEELSTTPVSKALLDGMFLEDAHKLRDEIYARRGKVFKNKWLQKYFASFSWYKANPKFTEALLSEIETKNIATIKAYEGKAESLMRMVEG
ncbi:MAG: YARHG domain-containing protein [Acidobacteria bacterium]|nr:YARHG domain-containing protein [Acidobacteriota bacterium]